MIIDPNSRTGKWFKFCLRLPFSSNHKFEYHLRHGTTLCHFMWVTLWLPLLETFVITVVSWKLLISPAINVYKTKGLLETLLPFIVVLVFVFIAICIAGIIYVVGRLLFGKPGEPSMVVIYGKALKDKVCPLIKFESKD